MYCISFFFFLSFNPLIVWQISNRNYCKTFLSLLYNFKFLCFWQFKYCSRGLPTAFFPDIVPLRMFTTNSLCLIICPIHECRPFFKICKLQWLIRTSMRLAWIDTNVCLCKMLHLLVYILDTILLFVYNGLHYVRHSDPDAIGVWNCEFNSGPWETGDFNACSVSLNTFMYSDST
jgi:hypothetical protein